MPTTEPFESPYYRLCDDDDCPVGWAYRAPNQEGPHWHFLGSPTHPASQDERST